MSLLEVRNLRIEYPSRHGVMAAVKDLSFSIEKGEILGAFPFTCWSMNYN